MSNNTIKENINLIKSGIAEAAKNAGRDVESVRLLAVSKTKPNEDILSAYEAGQRCFGENKPQDLALKQQTLPADIEWHMIGHLQKNKVRSVVTSADWIHSIDSLNLLKRVERIAGEKGRNPIILIQVNISGEESKFGCSPEELPVIFTQLKECSHCQCRGFMTIAPFDSSEEELKQIFTNLKNLRDQVEKDYNMNLPELSMGMSGDYPVAIECGATIIRVGTAIFGSRNYS